MQIINVTYAQQNEHYDPAKRWNGGGYDQPRITVEFDDGVVITISDTSCGDFGGRYAAWVTDGTVTYSAGWGSMCGEHEVGSDIPGRIYGDHLREVYRRLRYDIPTEETWKEMFADDEDEDEED